MSSPVATLHQSLEAILRRLCERKRFHSFNNILHVPSKTNHLIQHEAEQSLCSDSHGDLSARHCPFTDRASSLLTVDELT